MLTRREREVLELYIETGSFALVAQRLELSQSHVKNLLVGTRKRLRFRNTAQLIYALAVGDLDDDS